MQKTNTELEKLLSGKVQSLEIMLSSDFTRDTLIENINYLLLSIIPGCWIEGEFINKDSSDYMIYELHLSGMNLDKNFSSIRLLEFEDRFKLIRV